MCSLVGRVARDHCYIIEDDIQIICTRRHNLHRPPSQKGSCWSWVTPSGGPPRTPDTVHLRNAIYIYIYLILIGLLLNQSIREETGAYLGWAYCSWCGLYRCNKGIQCKSYVWISKYMFIFRSFKHPFSF